MERRAAVIGLALLLLACATRTTVPATPIPLAPATVTTEPPPPTVPPRSVLTPAATTKPLPTATVWPTATPTPSTGWIAVIPDAAQPGAPVTLRGWVPPGAAEASTTYALVLISSSQLTGALDLGLARPDARGALTATLRLPLTYPDGRLVEPGEHPLELRTESGSPRSIASASIEVEEATPWSALATSRPLVVQRSDPFGGEALTGDATNPRRVAYCIPGTIRSTADGGATWSMISTDRIGAAPGAQPYTLLGPSGVPAQSEGATCATLALDSAHPDSYYASFAAARKPDGAPPTDYLGVFTTDAGRSWQTVPTPIGYPLERFGGFAPAGERIEAIFAGALRQDGVRGPMEALATADGGRTWPARWLACPTAGPCVRWGPAPNGVGSCAMHAYPRTIAMSPDASLTWTQPEWPPSVNACDRSELAALSPTSALLLTSAPDEGPIYPVRLTTDRGRTWRVIALPALPLGGDPPTYAYRGLHLLPDGTLLGQSSSGAAWYLLRPGANGWCAVDRIALPSGREGKPLLEAIGDRLWWLASNPSGDTASVNSVPLNTLRCA